MWFHCAKVSITYISSNESAQLGVQQRFQRERKRKKKKKNGLTTCQRVKNHHYAAAERLKIADAIKLGCSDWGEWILSRSETENRAWKKQRSSALALCLRSVFATESSGLKAEMSHRSPTSVTNRWSSVTKCETVKVVQFVVLNQLDSFELGDANVWPDMHQSVSLMSDLIKSDFNYMCLLTTVF